ncbi:cell wall hydrolase [Bacillus wiedmannii]|uniref:cell wall hydrolase n=1 Tax=Bacillus wiedmannii TaxID=1890302 RepID=UPI0037BFB0AD
MVLNRVKTPGFSKTVRNVIYQSVQYPLVTDRRLLAQIRTWKQKVHFHILIGRCLKSTMNLKLTISLTNIRLVQKRKKSFRKSETSWFLMD